ncbi:MAG: YitT family protein [Oscillospiraceae bacterium]|nr:YitT family protein [Oscillospiraceae bacterium]
MKDVKKTIFSLGSVVLGNFLYALAVKLFLMPAGLVTGGTTGIALVMNHFWDIEVSHFVLFFNVVMLVIGFLILGKKFAATTLASTFLYPLSLELCEFIFGDLVLTDDLLLCTAFCGLGIGIALGIVIRAGASTGGMDIPPLVLNKLFKIPVSVSMYCFDFVILLFQILFRPAENVLYGIILVLIYTVVLDKMLMLGKNQMEVKIVSDKHQEICDMILHDIDRGVTFLHGQGGYLNGDTQLVLSVVSGRELVKLQKRVHEIDPKCFMVIGKVAQVTGRGFDMEKLYK